MNPFSEIVFTGVGLLLSVLGMLIVLGQIYLTAIAFSVKRSLPLRISAVIQLAVGSVWFCLLLDGSFDHEYFGRSRAFLPVTEWMFRSPWLVIAAIEAAFAALLCVSLIAVRRYRRKNLSQSAIKETVDMLPVGICFSKADGTVVLKNLLADSLCLELTGGSLNDANAFWESIESAGERQEQLTIVLLPSGKSVIFQKSEITVDDTPYIQLIASDITEQFKITSQLREKNQKLLDIQKRMKAYGAMAERLAMTEEILRARVSVHDEMGHLLLSGKYYLDHPEKGDRERLLEMERYTHLLMMREGEEPSGTVRDCVEDALTSARAMGVNVTVSGDLPQSERLSKLLAQAIRECAANAVKHASGDSMDVVLSYESDWITLSISTNGELPTEPIRESGGLLNLRSMIEASGGTMTVSTVPCFTLTCVLPDHNQ